MKKNLQSLLLLIFGAALAPANPVTIITITLPSNPDDNAGNWGKSAGKASPAARTVSGDNNGGWDASRNPAFYGEKPTRSLFTIVATTKPINGRIDPIVEESKILVIVKKGGRKILGPNTPDSAPAAKFDSETRIWSGSKDPRSMLRGI